MDKLDGSSPPIWPTGCWSPSGSRPCSARSPSRRADEGGRRRSAHRRPGARGRGADERLRRLYRLVEDGRDQTDDILKDRITALKAERDGARPRWSGPGRPRPAVDISPIVVERFGQDHAREADDAARCRSARPTLAPSSTASRSMTARCASSAGKMFWNRPFWPAEARCRGFTVLFPNGDPGRIRTCDPLIRNQVLYPLSYGASSIVAFAILVLGIITLGATIAPFQTQVSSMAHWRKKELVRSVFARPSSAEWAQRSQACQSRRCGSKAVLILRGSTYKLIRHLPLCRQPAKD